jgi:hypothetical protein
MTTLADLSREIAAALAQERDLHNKRHRELLEASEQLSLTCRAIADNYGPQIDTVRSEAGRLLTAARKMMPPADFEIWCVFNVERSLEGIREYLRAAQQ